MKLINKSCICHFLAATACFHRVREITCYFVIIPVVYYTCTITVSVSIFTSYHFRDYASSLI